MIKCNFCQEQLIWGGDDDNEAYGLEGDGIVSNYSCQNQDCNVKTIVIYKEI